jgi:hypothetical protein
MMLWWEQVAKHEVLQLDYTPNGPKVIGQSFIYSRDLNGCSLTFFIIFDVYLIQNINI